MILAFAKTSIADGNFRGLTESTQNDSETWQLLQCNAETVSVLGREEGYKVKYTPSPEGEGVYLTVYSELSPNTDSISFKHSLG